MRKDDPILVTYHAREQQKTEIPFKDYGPPLKDGVLDKEFIRAFGMTIPDKQYLVLGDNHAMSADSRVFGFVPQDNLQGAPRLIIWPPGERWGHPAQKCYPTFNSPRLFIWGLALFISGIWYAYHRRSLRRSIFEGEKKTT